jgi:hypothetical protein
MKSLGIARLILLSSILAWAICFALGLLGIIPELAFGLGIWAGVVIGISAFACIILQIVSIVRKNRATSRR